MALNNIIRTWSENQMREPANRRESIELISQFFTRASLAALPFGLAALFLKPGSANASATLSDGSAVTALQMALLIEYMHTEYTLTALNAPGLIPDGADRNLFSRILLNDQSHKAVLIQGLDSLGPANVFPQPPFDFSMGGTLDPFNNYLEFKSLAQAMADTAVRAYKGQVHNLRQEPQLMQTLMQIHSVEARQAGAIRILRNQSPWIVNNQGGSGLPAYATQVYEGEELTVQLGFNTTSVEGIFGQLPATAGTEAFDEPITTAQANLLTDMFTPQG